MGRRNSISSAPPLRIGKIGLGIAVELPRILDKFIEMRPKLFLVEEFWPAAFDPQNAQIIFIARIGGDRFDKFGPIRIIDPACNNIDLVSQIGHRHRHFLDIDELPAKVGMLGQIGVVLVEITLRIEEYYIQFYLRDI